MSARRRLSAALAGCLIFGSAATARAAVELPVSCGTELEFTAEVQKRLGSDVEALPTSLRIEPETGAGGYVLRMQVGSEQRELRDPSCRELFHAAVVVAATVALSEARRKNPALGGEAAASSAPASGSTSPSATPAAPAAPAAPKATSKRATQPKPAVAPARRSEVVAAPAPESRSTTPLPLALSLALGGGVFAGVTPKPAPRLDLEARLSISRFGVAAGGGWFPGSSDTDAAGRGVEVGGFRAALSGVWLPSELFEARLGACAYRLSGTGVGSFGHRSDGAWSGGLLAGILFSPLRHGRWWAGVALEGEWLLVRSRFEILNYREVFRVSSLGGAGLVKLGVQTF